MNVAIIGNGGRESAIAWAVSRSPKCKHLYIIPGNGGTSKYGRNVPADTHYPFKDIQEFVELAQIDVLIVGPEQPLVDGIVEALKKSKAKVFGPSQKAARLEGSKAYMKNFLERYSIPTARFEIFDDPEKAIDYVKKTNKPFVIKTDGLAGGKGSIVNHTVEDTLKAINRIMIKKEFGKAGEKIVVEDLLEGPEVSVFVVTDGVNFKWLSSAQDHKRIGDNDEGPNTGGMGAFAPVPFLNNDLKEIINENIIRPTIRGMLKDGNPYTGILYFGLMITKSGPAVIEYNVRLGDPEAQVILPLLKTDFMDIVISVLNGKLNELKIENYDGYCTGVVLASGGYPGEYQKGFEITGNIEDEEDIFVFHAGTRITLDGTLVTDGGRVMCVSALGSTLRESILRAYNKVTQIDFQGIYYRHDIGKKGLQYIEQQ